MTQDQKDVSLDHATAAWAAQKVVKDTAIKGLSLKLIAFIGAVVSTVGVLTFFWFDGLVPYRWWMIIGGALISGLFGWWGDKYQYQLRALKEMGTEEFLNQVVSDTEKDINGQDNASR